LLDTSHPENVLVGCDGPTQFGDHADRFDRIDISAPLPLVEQHLSALSEVGSPADAREDRRATRDAAWRAFVEQLGVSFQAAGRKPPRVNRSNLKVAAESILKAATGSSG
jgi:hypothetical protein